MVKILVVDDDPGTTQLIDTILAREGYQVVVENRGYKALDVMYEIKPDLVLLDVMMAGMDGLEVCEKIREDLGFASVPVIVFTATGNQNRQKAFELGANDFINKPIRPKELTVIVERWLKENV